MKQSTFPESPGFGGTLKTLANLSGCTYRSLAAQLNYSPSLIGKWVADETRPREEELHTILEKVAAAFYDSAQLKERIQPLSETLGLSPEQSADRKETVPRLVRILNEAYHFTPSTPTTRAMPQYHFYRNPESLLEDLTASLQDKARMNLHHSLRFYSNLDLCRFKHSVPQLGALMALLDPCDFHQVFTKSTAFPWLMQCLSVNVQPFIDQGIVEKTYYSFGSESPSASFLLIEDTGIMLELSVAGGLFYQWIPAPHHSVFLPSTEDHMVAPMRWQPVLCPCEDPSFEAHLLDISHHRDVLLYSLNYGHFILAVQPKSHTIPMSRAGLVYLRFLRSLTDHRQATCVFHAGPKTQAHLSNLAERHLQVDMQELTANLKNNWNPRDNNRYFFFSGDPRPRLQERSFWIVTEEKALLVLVDPDGLVPSYYCLIEGEMAKSLRSDILARPYLQEPFSLSVDTLIALLHR